MPPHHERDCNVRSRYRRDSHVELDARPPPPPPPPALFSARPLTRENMMATPHNDDGNKRSAEERGAHAVEGYDLQVYQHVHRRHVRVCGTDANSTPHCLLPRRHHILHLPVPEVRL